MNNTGSLSPANRYNGIIISIIFIMIGFIPVSCIAINVLQLLPLHLTAVMIAMPCFLLAFYLGYENREIGSMAIQGWLSGLTAVALYDCCRIPFICAGWEDFIPKIGDWILNSEGTNPLIGYSWRYIGNGGGMGIAFILIMKAGKFEKRIILKGIFYGLFIFSCLMLLLAFSPNGQSMMFKITPLTFVGSMIGHIVYGFVLGFLIKNRIFNFNKK